MEVIMLIGFIGVVWCMRRKMQQPTNQSKLPDEEESDLTFEDVQSRVERMSRTICQLSELEELITSLEITSPEEKEQPIQMQLLSQNGNKTTYEFWADGRNNTRMLTEVAYSERKNLRTSLLNQITELYGIVVTETVTETTGAKQERRLPEWIQ